MKTLLFLQRRLCFFVCENRAVAQAPLKFSAEHLPCLPPLVGVREVCRGAGAVGDFQGVGLTAAARIDNDQTQPGDNHQHINVPMLR